MLALSAGRGAAGLDSMGQAYRPGFAFPSGDPTHPRVSVQRGGLASRLREGFASSWGA